MARIFRTLAISIAAAIGTTAFPVAVGAAEPAPTGLVTCSTPDEPAGTGIVAHRICKVATQPDTGFPDYYDAYYSVRATLKTGPAFSAVGQRLDGSAGKVLGRITQKLFGVSRAKTLSIGWKATIGGQDYPVQILASFVRADNGDWTVSTNGMGETLLHRITATPGASVSLVYVYSDRANIDLTQGRELIGAAVPFLASVAATPIFTIAGKVAGAVFDSNSVTGRNQPTRSLHPTFDDPVLIEFTITDPYEKNAADAKLIASITVELRGTRSLLRDEVSFYQLADTLPRDGALDAARMSQMPSYLFTGSPSKWPAAYAALAGMGSNAPFGTALRETDVPSFCLSAEQAIGDAFPLTRTDMTLLKAMMLKAASSGIRDKVNPFLLCFDLGQRALIKAKLSIDTDYVVAPQTPASVTGFKSRQLLRTAAAWFVSKSCTDAEVADSPLADFVADSVVIGPRDRLPVGNGIGDMSVPPPPDNKVAKAAFLKATCGAFPYWNTLNDASGTFQVDQSDSKTGWRVTGEISGGKIASFSIVKL